MTYKHEAEVQDMFTRVSKLIATDTLGIIGYFAGALLAFRTALQNNYKPRPSLPSSEGSAELHGALASLVAGEDPKGDWIARFHLNSALHRIASLADRIVVAQHKDLAGWGADPADKSRSKATARLCKRKEQFAPECERIYGFVNKLKHDEHGSLPEATFTTETVLRALGSLLDYWEKWKRGTP